MPHLIIAGLALVAPLFAAVSVSAPDGTCEGRVATLLGTAGDDLLRGTPGDDVIVGLGGNDTIYSYGGNDVICGDEGSDTLAGYAGDDRIFGGLDSETGGDIIWPGVGNDFVDAGLDPLTRDDLSVPADTLLYSDLLRDGFAGGIRADLTPVGGLGVVVDPSGTDTVVVTEAISVVGTRAADVLIGSPYADVLIGRGGADVIDGTAGNDTLRAEFEDSDVDPATDGPDEIDGGPGNDAISLGQAGGTARGGAGRDRLEAGPATGRSVLRGDGGGDELLVGASDDVEVAGGGGADRLSFLLGPASRDVTVDGGSGRDLATLDVRKAGFTKGAEITVDLGRGRLTTKARAGRVRGLEVMVMVGKDERWSYRGTQRREDVIMRGGRSLDASMRGGRDSVIGTRGPDFLDLGSGRGDFANGRQGKDTCLGAEQVRSCESLRSGRVGLRTPFGPAPSRDAVARREREPRVVARPPRADIEPVR